MSKRWRTPSKQNGKATCPKDKINASWRGNLLKPGSRLAAVRKEYRTGTQVGWLAFHRLWVTNGWICERFEPWSHFIRYLSLIVRVNVVWIKLLLLTVTDVSTTCAVVMFRVKVSCITSVDGIILWLLIWLVNYVVKLLVVCQLSRDVIGYEDSYNVIGAFRSVYCHSMYCNGWMSVGAHVLFYPPSP